MIPTLIGITLVVFIVMAASPGGISAQSLVEGQNLDPQAKKEIEAYYNRLYGLDDPAPVQYLRWLNNVSPIGFTFDEHNRLQGFSWTKGADLGQSFRYGRSVNDLLSERLPITLLLNVLSIPIIYIVAVSVGVHAATERGASFDVASGMIMLALWSIPTMLAGVLLIGFFANVQYWHWFPTAGLNTRQAQDMPFLPHWDAWQDVAILLFSILAFTLLLIGLSQYGGRTLRVSVMAVLGLSLGWLMVTALPPNSASWILYIVLPLVASGLFALVGGTEFRAMRTGLLGMIGMTLGIGLAVHFGQGSWVRGFLLDRIWHLILPVLCLSYGSFAALSKLTRTAVLENLRADYARTARAKGVSEKQVLWRHVFRNSLLPLITVSSSLLPGLLAGSVIVESIFSIEGMGKLAVESVQARDRELVLSITLLSGVLTLLGYLIADLLYAVADPRVSYE